MFIKRRNYANGSIFKGRCALPFPLSPNMKKSQTNITVVIRIKWIIL